MDTPRGLHDLASQPDPNNLHSIDSTINPHMTMGLGYRV